MFFSTKYFNRTIHAGGQYYIGEEKYRLHPRLALKGKNDFYVLDRYYLKEMTDLLKNVQKCLSRLGLEPRISGGTLLGFERHGTVIPWDDDIDLHVDVRYRNFLYSKSFSRIVQQQNLECIFLPGSTVRQATKEGAACRVRKRGTTLPVCDIFFTETINDKVYKIDKWDNTGNTYSDKEVWSTDAVYPVKVKKYEELSLLVPNQPLVVLGKQYGENCMKECFARSYLISHNTPFSLFKFIWRSF
jgi:hypothetical protein